jgi:hypothetical protein
MIHNPTPGESVRYFASLTCNRYEPIACTVVRVLASGNVTIRLTDSGKLRHVSRESLGRDE